MIRPPREPGPARHEPTPSARWPAQVFAAAVLAATVVTAATPHEDPSTSGSRARDAGSQAPGCSPDAEEPRLWVIPRPGSDTAGLNLRPSDLPGETLDFRTCEGVLAGNRDFGLFQIRLAPPAGDGPDVPGWTFAGGRMSYLWRYPVGIRVHFEAQPHRDGLTLRYEVTNETGEPLDRVQIHTCITTTEAPSFFPVPSTPTVSNTGSDSGGAAGPRFRELYERLLLWRDGAPFSFASSPLAAREPHLAFLRTREVPIRWAWWVNAPETFDLPLIAARSRDGRSLVGLAFERAIWASSNVGDDRACFHLFPSFGRIEVGGRATVRGRLYVLRDTPAGLQARAERDLAAGFP